MSTAEISQSPVTFLVHWQPSDSVFSLQTELSTTGAVRGSYPESFKKTATIFKKKCLIKVEVIVKNLITNSVLQLQSW